MIWIPTGSMAELRLWLPLVENRKRRRWQRSRTTQQSALTYSPWMIRLVSQKMTSLCMYIAEICVWNVLSSVSDQVFMLKGQQPTWVRWPSIIYLNAKCQKTWTVLYLTSSAFKVLHFFMALIKKRRHNFLHLLLGTCISVCYLWVVHSISKEIFSWYLLNLVKKLVLRLTVVSSISDEAFAWKCM